MSKYRFKSFYVNSYPRSGNTWVRLMFERLIDPKMFDVNPRFPRPWFGMAPKATYPKINAGKIKKQGGCMIKSHEKYDKLPFQLPIIYLLRHPLNSIYSYYHFRVEHQGYQESWDEYFSRFIEQRKYAHFREEYLSQVIGDWLENVRSYQSKENVKIVKYEDLLESPLEQMEKILNFIDCDPMPSGAEITSLVSEFESKLAKKQKEDSSVRQRGGGAGEYQKYYSQHQLEILGNRYNPSLASLGYDLIQP